MVFYILTPHRIEAHEYCLTDFLADDVVLMIQSSGSKIATDEVSFENLRKAYPTYYNYQVKVDKV
jgi:hypothetical protein